MRRFQVTAIVAIGLVAGCRSLQEVQPAELEGEWTASQARYVEIAAPKRNNVDILDLGWEIEMTLDDSGNFVITAFPPEDPPGLILGSLEISGTKLRVTTTTGSGDGEVFQEGDQVAFRLTGGLTWDFGDGRGDIPSRLLLVLERLGG